jgi:hypothetical protein
LDAAFHELFLGQPSITIEHTAELDLQRSRDGRSWRISAWRDVR